MNPTRPVSANDLWLYVTLALVGTLAACSASVLAAAEAASLVAAHHLLITPPTLTALAIALIQHAGHPSTAFGPLDASNLPLDPYLYLIAMPIAATGTIIVIELRRRVREHTNARKPGDSRWATARDLAALIVPGPTANRLIFGRLGTRLIAAEPNHGAVVFGPTQSGKSSRFAIPMLLEHTGPALVTSVRNDLVDHTIARRRTLGPVYVYDPVAVTQHQPAAWTPLRRCTIWSGARRVARWMTSTVHVSGSDNARFWNEATRRILAPLLHAAALDDRTMRDVVAWAETVEHDEIHAILTREDAHDALRAFTATHADDTVTLKNVYASLRNTLDAYADPDMADCHIADSIDPARILDHTGTLYLCAPTDDQQMLHPVFAALIKDLLYEATLRATRNGPLDPSLLLLLDEIANIAPIDDLDTIASTCVGFGIHSLPIFQDLAQAQHRYGDRMGTIINNHAGLISLPGSRDKLLLDYLERLIGQRTIEDQTHTASSRGDISQGTHISRRALAAVNELRELPDDIAVLIYRAKPPARLTLRPWYDDATLTRLHDTQAAA